MSRLLSIAVVVLAFAAPSQADDDFPLQGAAPTFMFITEVDEEKGEAISTYTVMVPVMEAITVQVVDPDTGKVVEEVRTVTRFVAERRSQLLPLNELRVITPSGKVVPTEQAIKKMRGQVIVHAAHGIDPAVLKLFKDDVLIVMPRADAAEAPKAPAE